MVVRSPISLRAVNVNLLPILRSLLKHRSVSSAAQQLKLSQSSVSGALATLRVALKDQLLVRVGSHMELTPRAAEMASRLELVCHEMESLFSIESFDLTTSDRTFVIAAQDYFIDSLGGGLLATLARKAPAVKLRFVKVNGNLLSELAAREVDVAHVPAFYFRNVSAPQIRFRAMGADAPVALFRRGHPLASRKRIAACELRQFRMVLFHPVSPAFEGRQNKMAVLASRLDVFVYVSQITVIPFLVVDTDYVGIVPERMAKRACGDLPLCYKSLAFWPREIEMGLAWDAVQDVDAGHRWFMKIFADAAARGTR